MNGTIRVGITGQMGSGKSYFSRHLVRTAKSMGVPIHLIDVDALRAQLLEDGRYQNLHEVIVHTFGREVARFAGGIDREVLSDIVYRSPARRKALDAIVDPLLRKEVSRQVAGHSGIVAIDYALILEKNLGACCDYNFILLTCRRKLQLARLMNGDLPEWQIHARLDAQPTAQERESQIRVMQRRLGLGRLFLAQSEALTQADFELCVRKLAAFAFEGGA